MEIKDLIGKTFIDIKKNDEEIIFIVSDTEQYKMYHEQDCCEGVSIDDIEGDLSDLVGKPILQAEEVTNDDFVNKFNNSFTEKSEWGGKQDKDGNSEPESCTWTFYKLATINGYVTVRWYGESNGYYSEGVSFSKMKNGEWLRSWEEED